MSLKERRRALIIFLITCVAVIGIIIGVTNAFTMRASAATDVCTVCGTGTATYTPDTEIQHKIKCDNENCSAYNRSIQKVYK